MPRRNVNKDFSPECFYHVYNHGVSGQDIFLSESDYSVFVSLFKRYMSITPVHDITRRAFPHLRDSVELIAYCLMPNHFHLLLYNKRPDGITALMRSIKTSYCLYFNKIHKRRGVLFESSYLASRIDNEAYLWHISRYIHLNPQDIGGDFATYPYSSYRYFMKAKHAEWINPDRILALHKGGIDEYKEFVKDYKIMRAQLQQIKHELANS